MIFACRSSAAAATTCAVVFVALLVACSGSDDPAGGGGFVQIADFEILPTERTCPANAPVTPGGPGLPATYSMVLRFTVRNGTARDVTVNSLATNGSVTGARNDVGLGRPAHVFTNVAFSPTTPVPARGELELSAPITVLCGDSPTIYTTGFWDIATTVNLTTSAGPAGASTVTFRRNWEQCLGPGHPCPLTQPPLPAN